MSILRVLLLATSLAVAASAAETVPEPTNAAEAAARNEAAAKAAAELAVIDGKYQAWKSSLATERQAWEDRLAQSLGDFYFTAHKKVKARNPNEETAWDFVVENPSLPRVLLMGDSFSRGYTVPVRRALAGKYNVYRALENCGPTANGIKKLDAWLGDTKWDVIHFNFGIHDRKLPQATYLKNLEQIIARLQKTNAKLIWATTTPIAKDAAKYQPSDIDGMNLAATELMKKNDIAIDDLNAGITPSLSEAQIAGDVHFKASGYDVLGKLVAESILSSR